MKLLTSDMVFFLLVFPAQEEMNNNIVIEVSPLLAICQKPQPTTMHHCSLGRFDN